MPTIQDGQNSIVDYTRSVIRVRKIWSRLTWFIYLVARLITVVFGIIVPFGIAGIIYYPEMSKYNINIILLVFSFISLLGLILLDVFRVRERSLRLRRIYEDLRLALSRYEENVITLNDLNTILEAARESYLKDEVP